MGLFDSIFGTKESEIKDLWRKLKRMPAEQLTDIVKIRPNQIHGQLAFVAFYRKYESEAARIFENIEDLGSIVSRIKHLFKTDLVLLGEGSEFNEIRSAIKEISVKWPSY